MRPSGTRSESPQDCLIADVAMVMQHRAMLDWSDLLLLLPGKVVWTLLALFCGLIALAFVWAKLG